ncbi:MAG: hypothetical protein M3548_01750 [Actinomycetota bacterium]|nr:hypothetical protein [Actinomycetota bacterium]
MYVDETGGADVDTADTSADDAGHDELTVEVGGEEYEVEENYDYDKDGANDTAVVQTDDGYMAFTDTDGDGTADTMHELDQDGNVVTTAEYDESSGEWAEADPTSVENPSGDGADDSGSSSKDTGGSSTDASDTGSSSDTDDKKATDAANVDDTTGAGADDSADDTSSTSTSGDDITVDTKSGDINAGEAEYDSDGDGTNDTAVVTDDEGTTYAFTDSDGDGDADQAIVIEADGDVTVAENTGEDEWTTVETGQISADGSYESDSGTGSGPESKDSGSDAVWQG